MKSIQERLYIEREKLIASIATEYVRAYLSHLGEDGSEVSPSARMLVDEMALTTSTSNQSTLKPAYKALSLVKRLSDSMNNQELITINDAFYAFRHVANLDVHVIKHKKKLLEDRLYTVHDQRGKLTEQFHKLAAHYHSIKGPATEMFRLSKKDQEEMDLKFAALEANELTLQKEYNSILKDITHHVHLEILMNYFNGEREALMHFDLDDEDVFNDAMTMINPGLEKTGVFGLIDKPNTLRELIEFSQTLYAQYSEANGVFVDILAQGKESRQKLSSQGNLMMDLLNPYLKEFNNPVNNPNHEDMLEIVSKIKSDVLFNEDHPLNAPQLSKKVDLRP